MSTVIAVNVMIPEQNKPVTEKRKEKLHKFFRCAVDENADLLTVDVCSGCRNCSGKSGDPLHSGYYARRPCKVFEVGNIYYDHTLKVFCCRLWDGNITENKNNTDDQCEHNSDNSDYTSNEFSEYDHIGNYYKLP